MNIPLHKRDCSQILISKISSQKKIYFLIIKRTNLKKKKNMQISHREKILPLLSLWNISHLLKRPQWRGETQEAPKHVLLKRPSHRLPGTVTRLKYNCANFHYSLISTEQQRPLSFRHGKIHRGSPHKSHRLSAPDGYSQWYTCVCMCVHISHAFATSLLCLRDV